MAHTVLTRSAASFETSALTRLQMQVDGLVTRFVEEASNPVTLASLSAGGLAYRWGRIAVQGSGLGVRGGMFLPHLVRGGSVAFGLSAEVSAFEFTNRALLTLTPNSKLRTPNLWAFSGPSGLGQSLLTDLIAFGALRGAGHLARESNIILQHSFTSTAMVGGHQISGALNIIPRPEGSLAEQFLHAELTNIQLGAGTSLVHAMAPGTMALERGLDLSLRMNVGAGFSRPGAETAPLQFEPQWASVGAGFKPARAPNGSPPILMMSSDRPPESGGSSIPPRGETFLDSLRAFQKDMGRNLEQNIERHRGSWLGIYLPPPVQISDLIGRVIQRAQGHFGERTLQVIYLKKDGSPPSDILSALTAEFGKAQVGPLDAESSAQKRILVTTPALVQANLRLITREKTTLLILEEAADIASHEIRRVVTHFRLGTDNRFGFKAKAGNGMVIGFSHSLEGLGGFRISSPKQLPWIAPKITPPPPQPPPSPPAPRILTPQVKPTPPPPVRVAIVPPESDQTTPVRIPAPPSLPKVAPRPVWPPPKEPAPPPNPTPPAETFSEPAPKTVEKKPRNRPPATAHHSAPRQKSHNQAVVIYSTPTVTADLQKRIDAFWTALDEAKADEAKGTPLNPFLVGQRAWRIYLKTLPAVEANVQEHHYLQSLANHAPDDRIVQFLSEIGVRKRKK